ncbi:MAG TPA: hypothetical protein PLL78_06965 [Fimbriimonadaceae bacterium]|nr:hypothetical protein [Fimbriimonadaceae bacterium]HRJ96411.1 hypothetical protein [Fimbriimonadaceae bacterium]
MITLALALIAQPDIIQSRALDRVRAAGGAVRIEPPANKGYEIWIDFESPVEDVDLVPLRGLRRLTALRILGGGFGDAGVALITNVPDLWLLVLRSDRIGEKGVRSVAKITTLRKLDLIGPTLSRQSLAEIAKLPKLEQLYLYGAKLREADLQVLSGLRQIKTLMLPKSVSEKGIAELARRLPKASVTRLED